MPLGPFSISLISVKHLIARHNLGEPHSTLAGGEQWYSPDERASLDRQVDAELDGLGLRRRGRLDVDFLDMLELLQRPPVEYYAFARVKGKTRNLRGVRARSEAIVAISDGETLTLRPSRPDAVTRHLARQLPDVPPAPTHSLSCAREDFEALQRGDRPTRNSSTIDAKTISAVLRATRISTGQLFAAVRDRSGARRRSPNPPLWMDLPSGRLLATTDADDWVSVVGASRTDLAECWTALGTALSG